MENSNQKFFVNIHVEKQGTPYTRIEGAEPKSSALGHLWYDITDASGKVIASAGFATKDGTKKYLKFLPSPGIACEPLPIEVPPIFPVPGTVLHDDGRSYFG